MKWKLKDILMIAVCAVLFGVIFLGATYAGGALYSLLLPAGIMALGLFVTGLCYGRGGSPSQLEKIAAMPYAVRAAMSTDLYTALQLSTRLLAFAGLGITFAATIFLQY